MVPSPKFQLSRLLLNRSLINDKNIQEGIFFSVILYLIFQKHSESRIIMNVQIKLFLYMYDLELYFTEFS